MICKTEGGGNTRYAHDFEQQLTEVRTGATSCSAGGTAYTYSYDGLGRRVKTFDGTTTSYFAYSGSKMLYSKVGSTETAYVHVSGRLLLSKATAGVTDPIYYHHDVSSNVRLTTYYTTSA